MSGKTKRMTAFCVIIYIFFYDPLLIWPLADVETIKTTRPNASLTFLSAILLKNDTDILNRYRV